MSPGLRQQKWHVDSAPVEEQEAWLVTYLDMLTLLLVLLVIMLAMAGKGDGQNAEQAPADSLASPAALIDLAEGRPPIAALEPAAPLPADPPEPPAESEGTPPALGEGIEVIVNEHSISFRIDSALLFASGQAELANPGLDVLDRLLPTLAGSEHRILVEGHTDDQPIHTERFPSNWELSASRASSVVRYLAFKGIAPTRLQATGFAETRPLADNDSEAARARNRRVELVLQTGDG